MPSRPRTDDVDSGFADFLAGSVVAVRPAVAFLAAPAGEAAPPRTRRVAHMTAEARRADRAAGGRGAALTNAPGTASMSGRGQRLLIQKASAGGAEADARSPMHTGDADAPDRMVAGSHSVRCTPGENRGLSDPALGFVDAARAGEHDVGLAAPTHDLDSERRAATAEPVRAAQPRPSSPELRFQPAANATAAPALAAVNPASAAVGADPSTPARQIAQILTGRLGAPSPQSSQVGTMAPRLDPGSESAKPSPTTAKPESAKREPAAQRGTESRGEFETLVRGLRMNLGSRYSTARIRLSPPELGQVRVEVKMRDARLELRLTAERPEAGELLAERWQSLRAALERHGVVPDRMEWTVETPTAPHSEISNGSSLVGDFHHDRTRDHDQPHSPGDGTPRGDRPQSEYAMAESVAMEHGSVQEAHLDVRA